MLAAFDEDCAARAKGGRLQRAWRLLGTLADLVSSALMERTLAAVRRRIPTDAGILALRSALRNVARAPGITMAVLVTLGLGIGVTSMMYGVADRALLSPPEGIVQPDRVVRIYFDRVSPFTRLRRTVAAERLAVLGALLAALAVLGGQLGLWLFARSEGGVLGPVDYLAETFGLLVPIELLLAVVAGWLASR